MASVTIGFTQRSQTVSEADVPPGGGSLQLSLSAAAQSDATRNYRIVFEHLDYLSNATVDAIGYLESTDYDAIFGSRTCPGCPLRVYKYLMSRASQISPLSVFIADDFVPEGLECFTLRLYIEGAVPFTCNNDLTATDFFCTHTICIEDFDGNSNSLSY